MRVFALLCAALLAGTAAQADTIAVSFNLDSLPTASSTAPVTLSSAQIGLTHFSGGTGTGAYTITSTTSANQGIVQGNSGGNYAEPATGPNSHYTDPYFSTGIVGGITIDFTSSPQKFLGLIWGSVDGGNEIQFYNHGTLVGAFTGNDLSAATHNPANGAQGYGGSYYTALNDMTGSFDRVVLSSSIPSFESADFEASPFVNGVAPTPEPGMVALMLGGIGLIAAVRRRRTA